MNEIEYLAKKELASYKPFFPIFIEKNDFIIKTAETQEELIKTFKLRYGVYGEYYKEKPELPLDIDEFDARADHIIVKRKSTGEVIGTYRVLCSDFTKKFYTAREFQLDELLNIDAKLVEMGRATVSSEQRSGVVITLLWRGIADYILGIKADYLFGCATLWTQDSYEAAKAYYLFKNKDYLFTTNVLPLEENILKGVDQAYADIEGEDLNLVDLERSLPPLFKSYIKAGARFAPYPANDKKLQSIDFLSVLKITDLSPALSKKYLK